MENSWAPGGFVRERRPRDGSTHFSDFFVKVCFHPWSCVNPGILIANPDEFESTSIFMRSESESSTKKILNTDSDLHITTVDMMVIKL